MLATEGKLKKVDIFRNYSEKMYIFTESKGLEIIQRQSETFFENQQGNDWAARKFQHLRCGSETFIDTKTAGGNRRSNRYQVKRKRLALVSKSVGSKSDVKRVP